MTLFYIKGKKHWPEMAESAQFSPLVDRVQLYSPALRKVA